MLSVGSLILHETVQSLADVVSASHLRPIPSYSMPDVRQIVLFFLDDREVSCRKSCPLLSD